MNKITMHEIKSGLVLKRLLLGFLWVFFIFGGIYNCITSAYRVLVFGNTNQVLLFGVGIIFCLIPYGTRREAYRYIWLSYQCFPNLNRMLPMSAQKSLLRDDEVFCPIEELSDHHRKFTKWDRIESAHWIRINGYYISKELLIGMDIQNTKGNLKPYRKSTYLHFLYANGEYFEIRLEDALHRDEQQIYHRFFAEHCGTTSYLYSRKLLDSINKTYCEFLDGYEIGNGYFSKEEAIVAITKGGSGLKEHIKKKYHHYWDREERLINEFKTR